MELIHKALKKLSDLCGDAWSYHRCDVCGERITGMYAGNAYGGHLSGHNQEQ